MVVPNLSPMPYFVACICVISHSIPSMFRLGGKWLWEPFGGLGRASGSGAPSFVSKPWYTPWPNVINKLPVPAPEVQHCTFCGDQTLEKCWDQPRPDLLPVTLDIGKAAPVFFLQFFGSEGWIHVDLIHLAPSIWLGNRRLIMPHDPAKINSASVKANAPSSAGLAGRNGVQPYFAALRLLCCAP
jgi:hypothetical protein